MPQTRISERAHRVIRRLAQETGETSEQIVDRAVDVYERKRLLDAINSGYVALKADPVAWDIERRERDLCDVTLQDGDPV